MTPEATRLYTSDGGGLLYEYTPESGSARSAPRLSSRPSTRRRSTASETRTAPEHSRNRHGHRGGRTLQRYTTTSGRRVDYLIDPRTNELVAERRFTAEGRSLETPCS